jgi:hypothetical protein
MLILLLLVLLRCLQDGQQIDKHDSHNTTAALTMAANMKAVLTAAKLSLFLLVLLRLARWAEES